MFLQRQHRQTMVLGDLALQLTVVKLSKQLRENAVNTQKYPTLAL
jgi:hypothetical protein